MKKIKFDKKNILKILPVSILLMVAIGVVIYSFFSAVETETAVIDTMENVTTHPAIIIRNETVISPETDGNLRTLIKDGEMVSKGKNIATVYDKNADVETQKKLAQVSDKINEIVYAENNENLFSNDKNKMDAQISDKMKEMVYYLNIGDVEKALKIKSQINSIYDKKLNITGDKHTGTTLDMLKMEQAEYERILSTSKEEIYSPSSGYCSVNVDGFEELLTMKGASSLSVGEFDSVISQFEKKEEDNGVFASSKCKIIDNYSWSVALKVDEQRASEFEVGETVFINFDGIEKENSAMVESISETVGGYNIIILTTTEYNPDLLNIRAIKANLVKNRYTGLKVSNSAICDVNGQKGVYVLVDTIVKFKKVEVLYTDSKYSIVRENNTFDNSLLLYDEVIISPEGLYDGMSIR